MASYNIHNADSLTTFIVLKLCNICSKFLFCSIYFVYFIMAPSAVSPVRAPAQIQSKDAVQTHETQRHVHGAEDKTPLAAISHGILMDGEKILFHVRNIFIYVIR